MSHLPQKKEERRGKTPICCNIGWKWRYVTHLYKKNAAQGSAKKKKRWYPICWIWLIISYC
jgi:hypothetical protein